MDEFIGYLIGIGVIVGIFLVAKFRADYSIKRDEKRTEQRQRVAFEKALLKVKKDYKYLEDWELRGFCYELSSEQYDIVRTVLRELKSEE